MLCRLTRAGHRSKNSPDAYRILLFSKTVIDVSDSESLLKFLQKEDNYLFQLGMK